MGGEQLARIPDHALHGEALPGGGRFILVAGQGGLETGDLVRGNRGAAFLRECGERTKPTGDEEGADEVYAIAGSHFTGFSWNCLMLTPRLGARAVMLIVLRPSSSATFKGSVVIHIPLV